MATINVRVALAANATEFPIRDSVFEFVDSPSTLEVGVAADANGVLFQVAAGSEVLLEESPASIKAINLLPVYPDDFFQDTVLPQDKISIKLRDTSGAARVVMVQVRINPVA